MSHKISFREYGHGPILVLLHGYGGSVMHWDGVVDRLKDHYRVVVPNLSHLYISRNRLLFSVQVELVAEFIKTQFPGEKVHIAGLSFGGALAWGLSVQHPEIVNRLAVFNPVVPHPVSYFRLPEMRYFFVLPMNDKAILRLLPTPIGQAFLKRAAEIFRPDRENAARSLTRLQGRKLEFVSDLISHFSWILRNEDWNFWRVNLQASACPSLIVYCKDDLLFAPESYQDFAKDLGATKVVELEGAGHIISKSHPEILATCIRDFLESSAVQKSA